MYCLKYLQCNKELQINNNNIQLKDSHISNKLNKISPKLDNLSRINSRELINSKETFQYYASLAQKLY